MTDDAKQDQRENGVGSRELVRHLLSGGQICNGPQSIIFSERSEKGKLWCDTPGCCDTDFDSLADVLEYIELSKTEWSSVPNGRDGGRAGSALPKPPQP